MGIEDTIRSFLEQNYSPQSLIEKGYSKSTVYKIYSTTRTFQSTLRSSDWLVEDIHYNKPRYLPGDTIIIRFDLTNLSDKDLYLMNVGLQTEWMIDNNQNWYWYSQKTGDILKSGQKRNFSLSVPIPSNIALGEYEMRFGLQGQYLPSTSYEDQIITPRWSIPEIINIKYPLQKDKIFVSHSIRDEYLIRNLQKDLDKYGFEIIIGEDKSEPGSLLEEKFKRLIQSSTLFLALITESALRSKWVNLETNYAVSINKPFILLKEKSVNIHSPYEWTEFDRNDSTTLLGDIVMEAIRKSKFKPDSSNSGLLNILGIALLSFLVGWYLRK